MKRILYILLFLICNYTLLLGQNSLKGKVIDDKGEMLIGVIVMSKNNKQAVTSTDIDGNFVLKLSSASTQIISVSYIGYQTIIDTLIFKKGEEKTKTYTMSSVSIQLADVQVVGVGKKSDDKYMENVKAKSVSTIDFISSATMKRTGDANVAVAVGRISGVSTSGNFISVRGISDRYIKTTINGMRIPTLDPFTNNIKLDLFPSSLVDNIVLTKTPTADLPGDWAGAYISIETKDYPSKLMVNVESSFGYNPQTTFKNYVSSERSSTDWLGYDDGMRSYNHNDFVPVKTSINSYDEFVALGLGDYFKSMGVNGQNWGNDDELYFKLGLVELGLLEKGKMNDESAFNAAETKFNNEYYNKAYDIIQKDAVKSAQAFRNNWSSTMRKAPLSTSQSISIGNKTILFGKTLGYLAGFKYSSSVQYDPQSIKKTSCVLEDNTLNTTDSSIQKISKETNGWSGLLNLAYKFDKNNNISLMFMPNIIGTNNVKDVTKYDFTGNNEIVNSTKIFYEERKQIVYQFKSEHLIPGPNVKIFCNASYTNGNSSAPDFKTSEFVLDSSNNKNVKGEDRFYRYLTEKVLDSKLTLELPVFKNSELDKKLRFGGAYQKLNRKSDQYGYNINQNSDHLANGQNYSDPANFEIITILDDNGIEKHIIPLIYASEDLPLIHSIGYSIVKSGFVMFDFALTKKLRISGGTRLENACIYTDLALFDSLKLDSNDTRRVLRQSRTYNIGTINETCYLPSAAIIYKLLDEGNSLLNIKLNYARSVAYPSIREISDVESPDYELGQPVTGNPKLKIVQINNYDLRFEYSYKSNNNVSLNLFYKDFKNHIELIDKGSEFGYSWDNNTYLSRLKGIEIEGKKTIFNNFELRTNVAFINSESTFIIKNIIGVPIDTITRAMSGQAPFIINGIVSYTSDTLKMNITLSYNIQGAKLLVSGSAGTDLYERPRHLLDLKISKSLGKHFSTSFTMKDILSTSVVRSYRYKNKWVGTFDEYHWGTTYSVSLAYKL